MAGDDRSSSRRPRAGAPSAASRAIVADMARVFSALRTERLSLRRPGANDGIAMFRVHGDPDTNRYNPAGPDPDLATSEAALRDWLQQWQADGYGYWAVTLPPATDVVGFGGVRRIIWRDRDVLNLYYRLVPAVWGHGYAAELARVAVGLARTHLPQLPVVARTRPENLPSTRTAERAGLLRRPDLDTAEHIIYVLGWPHQE